MPDLSFSLVIVLLLVLCAEFVNGATDAPNAIATVISTRVLSPYQAIIIATVLNVAGTFYGTAVASTIGKGIVDSSIIDLSTVGAAMVAIICFSSIAWRFGLPTSESHALIAGLTGAGLAKGGINVLLWSGWKKVLVGLLFSTFLGYLGGLILVTLIYNIFYYSKPVTIRKIFGKAQILSSAFVAFTHGSNDGQKFIGAFTLALVLGGVLPKFEVPWEVIIICAVVMGVGTAFGGWRIIKTMGFKIAKLEPVHGFAAETGAALAIGLASKFGIPLSTTHTIGTSIAGVGTVRGFSMVRWDVFKRIVIAWIVTFPVCGLISWITAKIILIISGNF